MMSVAPGKPWTVPCSPFQATTLAMSRPLRVVDAAGRVGDRDDGRALLGDEPGRDRAGVAEALDGDARRREVHAEWRAASTIV